MITLKEFLMGREKASPITKFMEADAEDLLEKVNKLLERFYTANPKASKRVVTSGYRPAEINASTPGAAKKSKHTLCQAIDLSDADKELGKWLMRSPELLIEFDLYLEHKDSTPTWIHLQLVPPGSKRRIFKP